MDLPKFTQINDLVVMDRIKRDGRQYYQLSCSYGHICEVRCDSIKLNRFCSECKRNNKPENLPTVRKGFIKGQLKVLERLPHGPYEKPKVKVLCRCGNVKNMFSCNIIKSTQSFSCGECGPYYQVKNGLIYVHLSDKNGETVFVVDVEDANFVLNRTWTLHKDTNNTYVRGSGTDRVFLHRHLTDCPEGMFVDHINGNSLDNRRSNLRVVEGQVNFMNRKMPKNNTSGRIGIHLREDTGKWRAIIGYENRRISLGDFVTKEEAIKAREAAELFYGFHKNHGRLSRAPIGEDL